MDDGPGFSMDDWLRRNGFWRRNENALIFASNADINSGGLASGADVSSGDALLVGGECRNFAEDDRL